MPNMLMDKTQFVAAFVQQSGLTSKQARSAIRTINAIIAQQLGKQGPGQVLIPGLLKLMVVEKPSSPQHDGVNPFTQERTIYPAKAARKVLRARPLKALREAL